MSTATQRINNWSGWLIGSAAAYALLLSTSAVLAQDLHSASTVIAQHIASSGRKRVAVTDFTDLDGTPTKLGRFLAEEFSVDLLSDAGKFEVIDRTHLKAILQEHNLFTKGLIDPATARKLGQIAGVDALVTGTLTPFEEHVRLSLKVLDTETAKMLGATALDVPKTKTINDLISAEGATTQSPATDARGGSRPRPESSSSSEGVTRDGLIFLPQGCRDLAGIMSCSFSVTNKMESTRQLWFDGNTFLIDDQGAQYSRLEIAFGSKSNWMDNMTDLLPGVPVSLTLQVSNLPTSIRAMNAQLSYGIRSHLGNGVGMATFGRVTVKNMSISRR